MTEQELKRLEQAKELLQELQRLQRKLGEEPLKLTDTQALKQFETLPRLIDDAKRKLTNLEGSASSLYTSLKGVTSEIKNQGSGINQIRRGYRGLTDIAEKLKNRELGVAELNTKQLKGLKSRAKVEQERIRYNASDLISKTAGLEILEKEVTKKREAGETDDQINDYVRERLKGTLKLKDSNTKLNDEQKAIIQSYLDQNSTVKNLNAELDKQLAIQKEIDKKVRPFSFLADLTKKIPGLSALSQPFQDAEEEARKVAQSLGEGEGSMKVLAAGAGSLARSLGKSLSIVAITATIVKGLINAFVNIDKNAASLAKSLNTSTTSAFETEKLLRQQAISSEKAFIITEKLVKATAALNNQLGTSISFSGDVSENFVALTERLGISEQAAANIVKFTAITGKSVQDTVESYIGQATVLQGTNGFLIDNNKLIESIGTASNATLLTLRGQGVALGAAAFQARRLGLSFEQIENIGQNLLDFESSITSELEAELFLGRQLNLDKARYAALTGNTALLAAEVRKEVGSAAEFGEMNVLAQQALAKTFGMSRKELADMLVEEENLAKQSQLMNKLQVGTTEELQAKVSKLVQEKGLQGAIAELGGDQYAQMIANQSLQDKFNDSVSKLKEGLTLLVHGPLTDLNEGLRNFIDRMNTAISKVGEIKKKFSDIIPDGLGNALGKLARVGAVFAGFKALTAFFGYFKRGTPRFPMYVVNTLPGLGRGTKPVAGTLRRGGVGPKSGQYVGRETAKRFTRRYGQRAATRRFGADALASAGIPTKSRLMGMFGQAGKFAKFGRIVKGGGPAAAIFAAFDLFNNLGDETLTATQAAVKTLDQNKFTALFGGIGALVGGLGAIPGMILGGIVDAVVNTFFPTLNFEGKLYGEKINSELEDKKKELRPTRRTRRAQIIEDRQAERSQTQDKTKLPEQPKVTEGVIRRRYVRDRQAELNSKANVLDDFILRPGKEPLKYNKGDLIIGGTDLSPDAVDSRRNINKGVAESLMSPTINVEVPGDFLKGIKQALGHEVIVKELERLTAIPEVKVSLSDNTETKEPTVIQQPVQNTINPVIQNTINELELKTLAQNSAETNRLLKLIDTSIQSGKNISLNVDGNKLGQALVLSRYQSR